MKIHNYKRAIFIFLCVNCNLNMKQTTALKLSPQVCISFTFTVHIA
jgi:hypothetical protein